MKKPRMSIIDKSAADCEAFLRRHRLAYLRSVGTEIGITDLRYLAMREITELVEMVRNLDAAALRETKP
jgi:hypothetical protein